MELTGQQSEAHENVEAWLERHRRGLPAPQVYRLFGGAGTGKSTLAKLLASTCRAPLFAAPTGKAAAVLGRKGCPAQTIHQLIYQPMDAGKSKLEELRKEEAAILRQIEKSEGPDAILRQELREVRDKMRREQEALDRPFFALKLESELSEADLLCLDECSMPDQQMGEDLLSFGTPILAMGDPFQLPPVRGTGFFTQVDPDYLLTEVHRQALGSPILELATMVREGRPLPRQFEEDTAFGSACVMHGRPDPEIVMKADQLLCGRNATRISLNARCRELLGYTSPLPEPGDRLVCLRNNHELGLANGTIWEVVKNHGSHQTGRIVLHVRSEEGRELDGVIVHTKPFLGQTVDKFEWRDAEQFDFGYALTVHKAQGSQWDHVVLFDDWAGADRRQWLYTGITRAAESLLVVQ